MSGRNEPAHLPEKDYLAILDLIQKFHDCRSRKDLANCIQVHLLPFVNCEGAAYGFFDLDIPSEQYSNIHLMDCVGYDDGEAEVFAKAHPYLKHLKSAFLASNRPVVGVDIDFPREMVKNELNIFLQDHPEHRNSGFVTRFESAMAIVDRPDFFVALGVHRLFPNTEVFTHRDVRVLELLQPHLTQSIKTIALNGELKQFKAFTEFLAEVPTALALVSLDHRVIYCNDAFNKLLPIQPGLRLPEDLSNHLYKEITRFNPPFDINTSSTELPFYKLPNGVFRVVLTQLNSAEELEEQCWLLKLKPAVEAFSKMNLLMQERGLTGREMEIVALVRDGMDDQEIGDRLFISFHTVKNHLKSIHQKLNVHTRAKLVAVLNCNGDRNEPLEQV